MRAAFSRALVDAAKRDPRIVLLTGDHGYALFDDFRHECPSQYVNAGVAEQNMVGVAAGLAKGGFRPVVYGLGAFVPIRVLEQIKIDICYEKLPVVLMGDGAGLVYSTLGTSHMTTEDVAALRALPHMTIFSPADAREMAYCMSRAFEAAGPVYVRMGKADLGDVHSEAITAPVGSLLGVDKGAGSAAIIATGSMVKPAQVVARRIGGIEVWSAPSIKPIDAAQVGSICERVSTVITLEEHSVYGGLGSTVAEIATATHPVRVLRLGIMDRFTEVCGSYAHMLSVHGLDAASIEKAIREVLSRADPESRRTSRATVTRA